MRAWGGVLVFALTVLAPSDASAYRTLGDDPELGIDESARWALPVLRFDVHVDLPAPIPAWVESVAEDALRGWTEPACTSLRGGSTGLSSSPATPGDGRSTIMIVTSEWTERGLSAVAGATTDVQVARGPDGSWQIVEADIYVDWVNHPWVRPGFHPEGLDGVSVLRHELGHALGLLHPCELEAAGGPACAVEDRQSALYPAYIAGAQLSSDDEAGLCALYPAVPCAEGCPAGTTCESERCVGCPDCSPTTCTGASCAVECDSHDDCPRGQECSRQAVWFGLCVATGAVGASCVRADDCASSLCLRVDDEIPHCAQPCNADTDCAPVEHCAFVDGHDVCAPRPQAGRCSVGRGGSPSSAISSLALLAWWLTRRRIRKTFA